MILVINCGSSSLKFAIFEPASGGLKQKVGGEVRHIGGASPEFVYTQAGESLRAAIHARTHREALRTILDRLRRSGQLAGVSAVGHRIVHGGQKFRAPVEITSRARDELKQLTPLAPNHLPAALEAVEEITASLPGVTQVATFDTAFHCELPDVSRYFALPRELADQGVMRYGFHGLSYESVVQQISERGPLPQRMIIAHLGSGASLVAVKDGKSIDTTMGMTPAGGIPMSTRSGDLDPGAIAYLLRHLKYSYAQLEDLVDNKSGLLGLSGISADAKELLQSRQPEAKAAIEAFVYAIRKTIGAYAAALGGLDALVFTGAIGENSAEIRERVVNGLEFLGLRLDPQENQAAEYQISAKSSPVTIHVVHSNEDLQIARHTLEIVTSQDKEGVEHGSTICRT